MQFVIWVHTPSALGIFLSITATPCTATVYEAQREPHFFKQCILKLVLCYETQILRICILYVLTFFFLRSRSQRQRGLRRESAAAARLLGIAGSNPTDGIEVSLL